MAEKSIEQMNIRHGDLLFVQFPSTSTNKRIDKNDGQNVTLEQILSTKDGRIERQRDPHFCRHGEAGKCEHCLPLDPWDESFMKEKGICFYFTLVQGIKHMSFHTFLRKLQSGNSKISLQQPSFEIKKSCPYHAPYPAGICTKCQPSAITLTSQQFRMVDHVEFSNAEIVDTFLHGWRQSGHQCYGILLGKYEEYEGTPLGIKAVVHAIHQPPQDGSVDGFQLMQDPFEESIEQVASFLGLRTIGMIYTDLVDAGNGKVQYKRTPETFFVSGPEVLFMATRQLEHPYKTYLGDTFGSQFVTAIVTGDSEQNISISCYQASVTAESLVKANLIEASTDPSSILTKESTSGYTPEIFYTQRNEYGREMKRVAKPTFPVEYLLVTLTHGFPKEDRCLFLRHSFPSVYDESKIERVMGSWNLQDDSGLLRELSSFNAILYLFTHNMFTDIQLLARCIIDIHNKEMTATLFTSVTWQTFIDSLLARRSSTTPNIATNKESEWTCTHCTFINRAGRKECEMCSLPR